MSFNIKNLFNYLIDQNIYIEVDKNCLVVFMFANEQKISFIFFGEVKKNVRKLEIGIQWFRKIVSIISMLKWKKNQDTNLIVSYFSFNW